MHSLVVSPSYQLIILSLSPLRLANKGPGARLAKLWLTISLNSIEMNRRLLVNNDFIFHLLLGKLMISLIKGPRGEFHNPCRALSLSLRLTVQ